MLIDAFREVAGLTLTDEDGNTDVLRLLPPATAAEIAALEEGLPAPLPADVRGALACASPEKRAGLWSWLLGR
jgi:cell wall assembly regulator SMI1